LNRESRLQEAYVKKNTTKKSVKREKSTFGKDRRRKHHHYLVTVSYADGEKFGRVYTDKDKASRFAERQRKSPVVKAARISQVSWVGASRSVIAEDGNGTVVAARQGML
jgi:hypothetical protein